MPRAVTPEARPARGAAGMTTLPRAAVRALLALACLLFAVQAGFDAVHHAPANDEIVHIPSGYHALATRDYSLDVEQPPLVKMWAALPLLALRPAWPAHWSVSGRAVEWDIGRAFFAADGARAHRLVVWPRMMCVLLGVLLVLLAYALAAHAGGPLAGVVAAGFVAFEPNLLTAASIVYTDLGVALLALAVLALCAWMARRCTADRLLAVGAVWGLGIACKFTALLLLPVIVVAAWRGRRATSAGSHVARGALLLGTTALVVWAAYGFSVGPPLQARGPSAAHAAVDHLVSGGLARDVTTALATTTIPAPAFWRGLAYATVHGRLGHRAYLAGAYAQHGFLAYFPVTILVKTPLPLLLLAACGLLSLRWRRLRALEGWCLAGAAWILLVAMFGGIDIGYRHILLIVPVLILLGARVVASADDGRAGARWASSARGEAVRFVIATTLLAWAALDAGGLGPHHHAFFNALAGGPTHGHRLLLDSNLDLGQDLPDLAAYQQRQQLGEIALAYFGEADPAAYGVRARPFTPEEQHAEHAGVYAISVNSLFNIDHADDPQRYAWLRARPPTAVLGHTIWVFVVVASASAPAPARGGA